LRLENDWKGWSQMVPGDGIEPSRPVTDPGF
jgi:hypothetical protein